MPSDKKTGELVHGCMKICRYKIGCSGGKAPVGLKIVVAADLHSRNGKKALCQIAELEPDMICAPGDIMLKTDLYSVREPFNEKGMTFLKECRKIAPVYYSPGNHERGMTEENRKILADCGITFLDDEYVRYHSIKIGGLSSGYKENVPKQKHTPAPDVSFIHRFASLDGFKLLLCHHPEYWRKYLSETTIDLTLSGHAHGGQWQIPFVHQGIFAPGQGLFPKYTGGVHENESNSCTLVISRGMANTLCIPRFFNPREIVFLELALK